MKDEYLVALGSYLKKTRAVCGMTTLEVAVLAKTSTGHLSRIETSATRPSPELLARLLKTYKDYAKPKDMDKARRDLAMSYVPVPLRKHVEVHKPGVAEASMKAAVYFWKRYSPKKHTAEEMNALTRHMKWWMEHR